MSQAAFLRLKECLSVGTEKMPVFSARSTVPMPPPRPSAKLPQSPELSSSSHLRSFSTHTTTAASTSATTNKPMIPESDNSAQFPSYLTKTSLQNNNTESLSKQAKFNRESTTEEGIIDVSSLRIDFTKKLGEGGFGTVYRGKYRGKEVAVKQIQQDKLTPETQREFELEAKIMWQLKDPSVLHLYGVTNDNPRYMVLEYCALGSLRDHLKKKKVEQVNWELRFHLSTGIASGLQYLHTYNPIIIHGDLKSLNVLLTGDPLHPDTKIADFGMAKLKAVSSSQKTLDQASEGKSLVWAAPELFSKGSKKTIASDMYAFGMTLWEIATHQLPYHDEKELFCGWPAFYGMLSREEHQEMPKNTPPLFAKVITDCLTPKPADRPSAKVVLEKLQIYEERVGVENVETSSGNISTSVLSAGPLKSSSNSDASSNSPVVSKFLNSSNLGVASKGIFSSRSSDNTTSSSTTSSTTNVNSSPFNSDTSRFGSGSRVASSPLSSISSGVTHANSSFFDSDAKHFSTGSSFPSQSNNASSVAPKSSSGSEKKFS